MLESNGRKRTRVHVCVISAGRWATAGNTIAKVPGAVWYVPRGQTAAYRRAGAVNCVGVGGTLPMKAKQLNCALHDGFYDGRLVATLDDDIIKVIDRRTKQPVELADAISIMANALDKSDYYLAGPYSGLNTSWSPGLSTYGRIPGALMIHKPNQLRCDTRCHVEDLDIIIQHHVTFGGILLYGDLCLSNEWTDNAGGYQDYRTIEFLTEVTEYMQRKWGKYGASFKMDPTRKNHVNYRVPWKRMCYANV